MTMPESDFSAADSESSPQPLRASDLLRKLAKPTIVFWAIVILAVGLGSLPRIQMVDYGLPYIEYIDELFIYLIAQERRGVEHSGNIRGGDYPPAMIQTEIFTQQIMESRGQSGPAASVYALRLGVLVLNLAGIVWAAMLGRLIGGNTAAGVAALGWGLSTRLMDVSIHAISESFVLPLLILTLLFAAMALTHPRKRLWIICSLAVGSLIVLFEYRMVVALLPGLFAATILVFRSRNFGAREWIIIGLALLGIVILAGAGIVIIGPSVLQTRYYRLIGNILTDYLWDVPTILFYLRTAIEAVNSTAFIAALLVATAAWFVARRFNLPRISLLVLFPAALLFLIIPWLVSAVRVYGNEETEILERHIAPAMGLGFILLGAAIAQVVYILPTLKFRMLAFPLLTALVIFPQVEPTFGLARTRAVDPWPVIVREWADTNLTPGTIIVYSVSERWFNPLWGGIPHRKWFDWWPTDDIQEYSLDEWVEQRGMSYAAVPISIYRSWEETEAGRDLLSRTLLLREFVHPPVRREAEVAFLRLWRMQHETEVHFGDHIVLTGYDQSAETARPGDSVDFTFYWNAPTAPEDNYSLFVHFVPEAEYTVLAQADGTPAVPERPTLSWDEPGETLISPPFTLVIPSDIAPGNYRVLIGLYNFETGVRLPVVGSDLGDSYLLTTLHVEAD